MASNRKQTSDLVSEDVVLKIRKTYDRAIHFSEEYSIIWKIPRNSCNRQGYFMIDYSFLSIPVPIFQCYLKFNFNLEDYYDIVLELHETFLIEYPWNLPKTMHVSLSLIDKNKYIRNTNKKVIETINQEITKIDFAKFLKKTDLFDKNNSFSSNGELIIYCKIYQGEERNEKREKILLDDDTPAYCQLKVLDNFENLLESKKFSDMKFIIGSKELKVHKYILSAQSPVFEAMFKHNTEEQRNDSIKIFDISYETMTEVLRFVYSGKVNNIKKMAKDIFLAAEKYQIDSLKMLCENELIESIRIRNIGDMLKLIDKYDSKNLKKGVFNFISDNAKAINNIKNFDKILNTLSVNLLTEIVKLLMSRE